MTTDTEKTLRFHTYHLDHEPYPAAWGARTILDGRNYTPPHVDLVWDRQDCVGEQADKDRLLAHLNEHLQFGKDFDWLVYEKGVRGGPQDERHVLLDDDVVLVVASTQASYGYLYITAVLKGAA
jgi:hypothetical protein